MKSFAQQIFELNPNIRDEKDLLALGFDCMRAEDGWKSARYYFWYHEDFPSDFVSEYFWLQRQKVMA